MKLGKEGGPMWIKFDDAHCSWVNKDVAVTQNFGGPEAAEQFGRNALMLSYIRRDALDDVMCPVKMPEHLRVFFEGGGEGIGKEIVKVKFGKKGPAVRRREGKKGFCASKEGL
jgi:hypothetical protein